MSFGGFGLPGQGAAVFDSPREFVAQGFDPQKFLFKSAVIIGSARDAGNTPTTVLRPGLLLGQITASLKFIQWDTAAVDGSQNLAGILWKELMATDFNATNQDRQFAILVGKGPLIASQLLIKGTALTSHADQYIARRALQAAQFQLDDDPFGYKAGNVTRYELASATTLAPVAATDNGKTFYVNNAAAVAITLPTLAPGLEFTFVRTADEEMVVSSAAGNDMVVGADLSASSITFTTGSQQIGAIVHVRSGYLDGGTTLKWFVDLPAAPYGTGTATMAYGIT